MDDLETETLRARVRDLECALKQNNDDLMVTFRLTPVLNNLMGLLMSVPLVKTEMIQHRLGIAADAKVAVHRLRTHMKSWDIEIMSRRNLGYWLEPETKEKVKAYIREQTAPAAGSDHQTIVSSPTTDGPASETVREPALTSGPAYEALPA